MTASDHWQRVEAIFHAVADEPAGPGREATVAAMSGGDAALAAAVHALLAEEARLHHLDTTTDDPHLGLRLGHYVVERLIARGGMAAVYEAHRADDQFRQRVAVKIMDLRLSDPALVVQFRAERQILAALEHPILTRLLDGGVTALGEPYLVMEFVEGQAIDRYCDTRQLDLPARLRLFAQVCEGVAFAHRNLVLHRDLKPSNILVTADGRVKVVDFGTATLLQPDRLSTISKAPLTPAYASPEQLIGQAVGTASDQYSLGLVLYELLVGTSPFAASRSLMAAMERALTRTATTAPDTVATDAAAAARRTTLAKLRRTLTGDLGTIVGKTLAHEPTDRYASVQHVADDLARWLAGEPILGRAPSLTYRASRFVRRHWVAVSVAASLFVALVGATAVSVEQARVARAESGKARQLNRFLTQMLSSANPSWYNAAAGQAGTITVRQVLDGASALIPVELGDAPAVEAEMRRTLGRTYIGLGAADEALTQLQRALALYQAEGDAFGVAFTQMLLGEQALTRGDYRAAEPPLRAAVAYVRSQGEQADPELHLIAVNDLAVAINSLSPNDPATIPLLKEAIAVGDRYGINPGGVSSTMTNLGQQYARAGRLDEAETTLRDALRRMRALPAPPPEQFLVMSNLANVLRITNQPAESERLAAAAVEGAARSWGPDHFRRASVATTWGRALVATGDVERGHAVLAEAYTTYRKSRPANHVELLSTLTGLGTVHRLQGRLDESERVLREARAICLTNPAAKDRGAEVAGELGLTLRARGQAAEAEALLRESYDTFRAAFGDAYPGTVQARARVQGGE